MHGAPRTILPGKTMTAVPSNFSVVVGVLLLFRHPRYSGRATRLRQQLTRKVFAFVRSTDAVKKIVTASRNSRPVLLRVLSAFTRRYHVPCPAPCPVPCPSARADFAALVLGESWMTLLHTPLPA